MTNHQSIFALYPMVVTITGDVAYDKDGQIVQYNMNAVNDYMEKNSYKEKRAVAYPDFKDYIDGIVKGDDAQIQAYISACKAVKALYPKT